MLIFLDIDGVMVPAKSWERPVLLKDGFPAFSSKAIGVLQNLITANTTIILTTSHKSKYTIDKWKSIFEARGIIVSDLQCLDNNVENLSRKDEILNWFNMNDFFEDFLILDDDKSLNDLPRFLKDNLILTSPLVGLSDSHLDNIHAILSKGLQLA
jgi:hypothetical protein